MNKILYIVVTCYNEEAVLKETSRQLKKKLLQLMNEDEISKKSKVLYVNDGSKDKTWSLIKNIHKNDALFTGISLSRNCGQENALLAGLMTAKQYADIVISIDADLQDDVNAIDKMLKKYEEGYEIVYGVRSTRKMASQTKKFLSEGFYKFMNLLGVECVYNHGQTRLTSRRVLNELEKYHEVNLFLRGIFPLIGFRTCIVSYDQKARFAGDSKYSIKKLAELAWDGITSFSVKPLRMICVLGVAIMLISILALVCSLIRLASGGEMSELAFLMISLWFIGGLQLFGIGIVGEYIGKIYRETKARPRYIIAENLSEEKRGS